MLTDAMSKDKCSTCGGTNGHVISRERVDEDLEAGVYFNIGQKTGKRAKKPRSRS